MLKLIIVFVAVICVVACSPASDVQADACTVTSYSDVDTAVSSCTEITINGITVPAGETLTLHLKESTVLTLKGTIKFEYKEWEGPLMEIQGKKLTVNGEGSTLDGQGALYWDGLGDKGIKKPKFFKVKASAGSVLNNVNILNCPRQCVSISNTDELTLSGWNIDVSDGDSKGGHNTDGFDISKTTNLVIKNTTVKNQDDCIAVNQGSNLEFVGMYCSGGHGLSLSVGESTTTSTNNQVSNVVFSSSTVVNSRNGIHVKTHTNGAAGYIVDVTYEDITLKDITNYGINIQEDYRNGGSTGKPVGNIPITNLKLSNVKGTVTGSDAMPIYVLCGDNGCNNWEWTQVSVTGGSKASSCNYTPAGFSC